MDRLMVGREYASHLSETDLRVLASAAAKDLGHDDAAGLGPVDAAGLRGDPETLLRLLETPSVFRTVLGPAETNGGWVLPASPFLVFAALVQQAAAELASMDHVPERTGLRQRVPLFDAPALRDFLSDPGRRLFLTELLASFTRVASGRYRVRVGGRMRTRRFSELDPVRLAGLLDAVPAAERPGVYRRLGDVTLFLTGVFPDYAVTKALGPLDAGRLMRAAGLPSAEQERVASTPAMEMLEYLGARWYRSARDLAPAVTARVVVVGDVGARFQQARRVLNHLTDRYLLTDTPWFEQPGF
jgi:hypothetical protein